MDALFIIGVLGGLVILFYLLWWADIMRNPFHARSMAPHLRERVGLMAMCLLVTVVRPTKPRHRTFFA